MKLNATNANILKRLIYSIKNILQETEGQMKKAYELLDHYEKIIGNIGEKSKSK